MTNANKFSQLTSFSKKSSLIKNIWKWFIQSCGTVPFGWNKQKESGWFFTATTFIRSDMLARYLSFNKATSSRVWEEWRNTRTDRIKKGCIFRGHFLFIPEKRINYLSQRGDDCADGQDLQIIVCDLPHSTGCFRSYLFVFCLFVCYSKLSFWLSSSLLMVVSGRRGRGWDREILCSPGLMWSGEVIWGGGGEGGGVDRWPVSSSHSPQNLVWVRHPRGTINVGTELSASSEIYINKPTGSSQLQKT